MQTRIPQQANRQIRSHLRKKHLRTLLLALSCIAVFCTAYALILPAITLTPEACCGLEAHTHNESCYNSVLICGQDDQIAVPAHEHTEACYEMQPVLVCGLEETGEPLHVHTPECYDADGNLTCGADDSLLTPHIHTEACYEMQPVLVCPESTEPILHTHTDQCYERTLVCEKPEHTHTQECYSDQTADVESPADWDAMRPDPLSGSWPQDVLAVAERQLGYRESDANYIIDENGVRHGYTRYGAWYGDTYGEWCAMFASFCLHYAGVPEADFPVAGGCSCWITALTEKELYQSAALCTPKPGDLVFFDMDGDGTSDHVGLVSGVTEDAITTIEGNVGGAVVSREFARTDGSILGYGVLPEAAPAVDDAAVICGLTAHTHTADCYDAGGSLVCPLPEHTHTEACFAAGEASTQEFTYEDTSISLRLTVESAQPLPEGTELTVSPLPATAQLRANAADSLPDRLGTSDRWILRDIALTQDGAPLDTGSFAMTADVRLTQNVYAPLTQELAALAQQAAPEADLGVVLTALQADDETQQLQELDSAVLTDADTALHIPVRTGTLALRAAASANPNYTVQYYAWIPRFRNSGEKDLTVFDTSAEANGGKPKTPTNGGTNPTRTIYLDSAGGLTNKNAGTQTALYKIATENVLTQMYTENHFEYIKAPNPSYVDKLIENDSYQIQAVWVLKDGHPSDSTSESDWDIYSADVHFTNRDLSGEGISTNNIVTIKEGTVIRLIYNTTETDKTLPATFYDYDISSGRGSDGRWLTGTTGINIEKNYGTSRNKQRNYQYYCDILAFGNANTGTGMAKYLFGGGYLNSYNWKNEKSFGCTFGLADSLDNNGHIVYNEWLVAPRLFNEDGGNDGSVNGKHTYENSTLTFKRVGDTYTLSAADVNGAGSVDGLQNFFHPSPTDSIVYDGRQYTYTANGETKTANRANILTNDFWPMDSVPESRRSDPLFGSYHSYTTQQYKYNGYASYEDKGPAWVAESGTFPGSDDGQAHNSYFGMQYAVKFTLTEDYVGPLEYYFFGDDDMWVFLDDKLVCDIGGVHSSVGEYVNLWDHLQKGTAGEHTLTFFYTERGASGSTCFMNFTLPSVSGINIEQRTGNLRIEKQVVGESDPDKEFTFNVQFFNQDGQAILDDYAYNKYDKDGNPLSHDLILHTGNDLTLKAGEYAVIQYLPFGLQYRVTETGADDYTVTNTVNGVLQSGASASGTVIKDEANELVFTNTIHTTSLRIQKQSDDPTPQPLPGAVFTLSKAASASEASLPIAFVKQPDGTYAIPSATDELIRNGETYYIGTVGNDHSDSPADLKYALTERGTESAQIQSYTGGANQQFRVHKQSDGSYAFESVSRPQYWLDLDSGHTDDGTMIHFWKNDAPGYTEKWFLMLTDGYFKIKPRQAVLNHSSAVMDMNTGNFPAAGSGQDVQAWVDNASGAQRWFFVPVNSAAAPATTTQLETDANGILTLTGLAPATYTLTETTTPDGFVRPTAPIVLHVDAAGHIDLVSGDAASNGSVLCVTNRREPKTLTITKQVEGVTTNETFHFTVRYTDKTGAQIEQTRDLKHGETSAPLTIPYGASVTVSEPSHGGYRLRFESGGQTFTPNADGSCTFAMTDDLRLTAVNTAAGYELPSTGGAGYHLYTVGGLLLLLAAALGLYDFRRRRRGGNPTLPDVQNVPTQKIKI